MTDSATILSRTFGVSKGDLRDLWNEARANLEKLRGCSRHRFEPPEQYRPAQEIMCQACGGRIRLTDIALYIQGYEAAGGNADDIWPGFRTERR